MRRSGRGTVGESEDFSDGHRLFGPLSEESGANVEVARVKEREDVCWREDLVYGCVWE